MALLMLVGPKCCLDIVRIESFSVNVIKGGKILVYVVVVMFNTWKRLLAGGK